LLVGFQVHLLRWVCQGEEIGTMPKPSSVRGYVQLAADLVRFAYWVYMVVNLITNYKVGRQQKCETMKAAFSLKMESGLTFKLTLCAIAL